MSFMRDLSSTHPLSAHFRALWQEWDMQGVAQNHDSNVSIVPSTLSSPAISSATALM